MKAVALMLKAIHSQESKEAAREKAIQVAEKLKAMKLVKAAQKVEDGIEETLTYMDFPTQHWTRIRTDNTIERLNREIKRRTKAIGAFPDGQSALMLVCARLRHVAATNWGARRYMNMDHLFKAEDDLLSDIIVVYPLLAFTHCAFSGFLIRIAMHTGRGEENILPYHSGRVPRPSRIRRNFFPAHHRHSANRAAGSYLRPF